MIVKHTSQVLTNCSETPMDKRVFKIVSRQDWDAARSLGSYAGSADDVRDGFIHLSSLSQIAGTLARHFANAPDLLLVAFDSDQLGPHLKFETSRGGSLFPHLYAPLPTHLALWAAPVRLTSDGSIDCDHETFAC